MKRLICLLMVFSLLLAGCGIAGERVKEPVTFYYVRKDYQKDMGPVIESEIREASGHKNDLAYLLALYSMGPSAEDLRSPIPRNVKITLGEHIDNSMVINLSESALTIGDADFTVAAACIAMTCMELAHVASVTVVCGERNITIREDNLLLQNSLVQKIQEERQ